MTPMQQIELEAAAFRRLISPLKAHSDVQNMDLMLKNSIKNMVYIPIET